MSSHENGYHDKVSGFITDFYGSALKGQKYLGNALLTGIQRVAKESIFSKLNNIIVYTVLDEQYARYFGLTPEESSELLHYYDLELNESVRLMYDGYRIGSFEMYNPWSMTSYCQRKKLKPYWVNTSSNSLIRKCLNFRIPGFMEKQNELLEKGSAVVLANLETAYAELESEETLWGLFINAGYLTVWEEITPQLLRIAIPNREVKDEFQRIVTASIGAETGAFENMTNALITGDYESFKKIYQAIVRNCVSYQQRGKFE